MHAPSNPPSGTDSVDATRRTYLASERTQLAWWRTGLTALAVALAVGRVVPDLSNSSTRWPYVTIGAGFALYGVALIAYGTWRGRAINESLQVGEFRTAPDEFLRALAYAGIGLGILTVALVVLD